MLSHINGFFASLSSIFLTLVATPASADAAPSSSGTTALDVDAALVDAPDVTDLLEPVSSGQPVARELELPMPRWTYELDDEDTMLDMQAVTEGPRTRNLVA